MHHSDCISFQYGYPYFSNHNEGFIKTTIEISDALLREVRKLAAREGLTLRALMEKGLRQVVAESNQGKAAFKLRSASFKGKGMQAELRQASWAKIRDLAYEDHGA